MIITTTLTAGQAQEYTERSDFFRLLDTSGPVSVIFYENGREVSRAEDVGEGYAEKFGGQFDKLRIESPTTQSVHFVTRLGNTVAYDKPPTGSVTVAGSVTVGNFPAMQGGFTQAQKTVTTTSAQLLAAKSNRRYLLIQNNDASGVVYVNLQGSTATAANGFRIEPGGSLEIDNFAPSGAITAIGSIASNANVVTAEG